VDDLSIKGKDIWGTINSIIGLAYT
jgi:hypothetical protein